jgi:hypothetical protein
MWSLRCHIDVDIKNVCLQLLIITLLR